MGGLSARRIATVRGMPQPDDRESLRLNYSLLFARHQASQSNLWTIVSMTLASEVALWVGMVTQPDAVPPIVFGLGLLMVGGSAPLAIRFIELNAMLDRQLLGTYEQELGTPARLCLEHGRRLEDRFITMVHRLPVEAQQRARKRRIAKHPSDGKTWHAFDKWLSTLGQPSMMWTAVIYMAAIAGASAATWLQWESTVTCIAVAAVTLLLFATPWFLAAETGPVAALRRRSRP